MFAGARFAAGPKSIIFSPTFWSWAIAPPCPCVDRFGLFAPGTEVGRKKGQECARHSPVTFGDLAGEPWTGLWGGKPFHLLLRLPAILKGHLRGE